MKKIIISILLITIGISTACSSVASGPPAGGSRTTEAKESNSVKVEKTETEKANIEAEKKEELVEIYDGRKDIRPQDFSESETKAVQAEFDEQIELIKDKMGGSFCSDLSDVNLNGIAKGSFTKPNSRQTAILYDVCRSGSSNFGVGGLVIFEKGKAVSHYVYGEHGLQSNLTASSDVNKNGLNELILIDYQMHQGNSGTAILLAEIKNGNLKFFGSVVTSSSNSGAVEDDMDIISEASRISVQPSANPIFYRDSYEIKGNKKDWSPIKKGEKFSLNRENVKMYSEDFKSLEITQWN